MKIVVKENATLRARLALYEKLEKAARSIGDGASIYVNCTGRGGVVTIKVREADFEFLRDALAELDKNEVKK